MTDTPNPVARIDFVDQPKAFYALEYENTEEGVVAAGNYDTGTTELIGRDVEVYLFPWRQVRRVKFFEVTD